MSLQQALINRAEMPPGPSRISKPRPQTKKDQLSLAQYRD
jgi:hypothetical protein